MTREIKASGCVNDRGASVHLLTLYGCTIPLMRTIIISLQLVRGDPLIVSYYMSNMVENPVYTDEEP